MNSNATIFKKNELTVKLYPTRLEMGIHAAKEVAARIHRLLQEQEALNMVFAAAPSQNEFLEALTADTTIDWSRINAFHMDEYIGLEANAPQGFGHFLKERIFGRLPFRAVFYLNGQVEDVHTECVRYSELLQQHPVDIVCLGIGENGHLAFNDPHVADFDDPARVKVVSLDEQCRRQQVHDGCFNELTDVPLQAFTLTIPALTAAAYMYCIVPAKTKAAAVFNALYGDISEACPASVLRRKREAVLYLDADSASAMEYTDIR